jgi:hypothetical protein
LRVTTAGPLSWLTTALATCARASRAFGTRPEQKALEALAQVDSAVVSHESGTAVVTLNAPIDDSLLKKAVEDQGYTVVG